MSNRLSGKRSLAYVGTDANQPPNWTFAERDPNQADINYSIGDFWLNTLTFRTFVLISLKNIGLPRPGPIASWVPFGGGAGGGIISLKGSTDMIPVFADGHSNVTIVTNIPNLTITSPVINQLHFGMTGAGGLITQLQGDVGAAVSPTAAGIINVNSASPALQFDGTVAAHTLTLQLTGVGPGTVVQTLSGTTPTAVTPDIAGNIHIDSAIAGLTVVESASTLTLTSVSGGGYIEGVITDDFNIELPDPVTGYIGIGGGYNISTIQNPVDPTSVTINIVGMTDHSLQVGNALGALSNLGVATNGQIPIGSTGADPVLATLTAGANVTIVNGPGTITISSTGGGAGFTWQQYAVNTPLATQNGYIANAAGTVIFTLPATANIGDTFIVTGRNNATGWRIAQNALQTIYYGTETTTTGILGYLESTEIRDTATLVCTDTDTEFTIISSIGNITVV